MNEQIKSPEKSIMLKPADVIPYRLIGNVQYYSRYLIFAHRYPEQTKYKYLGEGLKWSSEDDYNDLLMDSKDILEFVKRFIDEKKLDTFVDGTSLEEGMKIIAENIKKML